MWMLYCGVLQCISMFYHLSSLEIEHTRLLYSLLLGWTKICNNSHQHKQLKQIQKHCESIYSCQNAEQFLCFLVQLSQPLPNCIPHCFMDNRYKIQCKNCKWTIYCFSFCPLLTTSHQQNFVLSLPSMFR